MKMRSMTANKKILFISYDGMTDPLGQSQVIPYLVGLTKYGYEFTILSCDKPLSFKNNKEHVLQLLEPYPIKWVSIPYHKSPVVLSSMYDVHALKQKAKQLYRKEKFDMVHTRPGIPALIGLWMKKKFGIKFLNDIREFYADSRVDGGMWNLKNPVFKNVYKYFKDHESACIENAEYNTCLTYNAEKEIHSWKKSEQQPIPLEVIPCSVDLDLFNPSKINEIRKLELKTELEIEDDDIIISYLGSIGGWYLTNEMMQFCKVVSDKIPKAKFLFISPHRHNVIKDAAAKFGLSPDKIIVKNATRDEVPVLLSFSSYSVFFIKPCYSKKSSSPTKHGEIMAMGIPVITNAGVGDVEEVVNKYEAGIVLKELNITEFEKAAAEIASEKKFSKEKIIHGAKEFYSLDNAVEKYLKVYKTILA